jgi:hypothetical protein
MPFLTRTYVFQVALFFLLAALAAGGAIAAPQDTLRVPVVVHTVEGLLTRVIASGVRSDSFPDRLLTLTQTNNVPFLSGPASSGPALGPSIPLIGRPSFAQAGVYSIQWTLENDSLPPATINVTTTLTVHDLVPPTGVHANYVAAPGNVPISNGTGVLTFVVWDGSGVESDPVAWNGYRVRRTIHGASTAPLTVAGQYLDQELTDQGDYYHQPVSPVCFAQSAPCIPDSFVFNGTGIFFRGFRNNSLGNGRYVIDYPPGAPVDRCDSCWVFADLASLAGFRTEYAVSTVGPFESGDYVESPLSESVVVGITPATPPASNLERVAVVPNPYRGNAEWDPAVGEGRIHFIHIPAGSTVRIFTSNAELVRELKMDPNSSPGGVTGELFWDIRNGEGRKVVSGIYLYQVETPEGRTRKGHFVIIK